MLNIRIIINAKYIKRATIVMYKYPNIRLLKS